MNVLDENVVETQCRLLRKWRIRFRQIGFGVGREGMKDSEIISLLHDLSRLYSRGKKRGRCFHASPA